MHETLSSMQRTVYLCCCFMSKKHFSVMLRAYFTYLLSCTALRAYGDSTRSKGDPSDKGSIVEVALLK